MAQQVKRHSGQLIGAKLLLLLCFLHLQATQHTAFSLSADQAILLDTTEQSSLGWTRYPDGGPGGQGRTPGWSEETFLQVERDINWRSFVTCDVAYNSVNNWLWTPYLERGDASRLYIEIKFTMRDCNLFPQMVLSCKETFALLYKEVDGPMVSKSANINAANLSFAQSDSFTLIDAIAADEGRFTSNSDVVINTEIRSVPVSKRGLYFAFRDQGACLSLISIKVYALKCPQLVSNFAHFNATPTGKDLTSLVAVEGECVANALQVEQPKMFCTADGQWNSMSSGQCKCLAGYEPQANQTKCQACPPGRYKAQAGDSPCLPCPERSSTGPHQYGATECKCFDGFYRAPKDSRASPCTQPPAGPPTNLSATYVDASSVVLQWQAPRSNSASSSSLQQRDDLTYKLLCDNCDYSTLVSSPQFVTNFSETKCVLSGLAPATTYRFMLYAMNGVTLMAMQQGSQQQQQVGSLFSEITIQTARQAQQTTSNTLSSQNGGFQLLPVYNFRALPGARGHDMILAWEAQRNSEINPSMSDDLVPLDGSPSTQPTLYEVKFAPRLPTSQSETLLNRRSPYPLMFDAQAIGGAASNSLQINQQQTITTTNRAIGIYTLQPRTEYAFQIRAKWHSQQGQWTEWSEPIFALTGSGNSFGAHFPINFPLTPAFANGVVATQTQQAGVIDNNQLDFPPIQFDPMNRNFFIQNQQQQQAIQPLPNGVPANTNWLGSFLIILFCSLIVSLVLVITLLHYRNSICLKSLGSLSGNLMGSNVGSTYAGVYNGGTSSDLIAAAHGNSANGNNNNNNGALLYGNTSAGLIYTNGPGGITLATPNHHHAHLHHAHHLGSAGALITGSNSTSRSSSGAGNVVQNFIAATLGQFGGGNNNNTNNQSAYNQHLTSKTLSGGPDIVGKSYNQQRDIMLDHQNQPHQHELTRNHYHQMLGNVNHTLLLSGQHGQYQPTSLIGPPTSNGQFQQQQQLANGNAMNFSAASAGNSPPQVADLFGQQPHHNHHHHQQQQQSKYGNSRTLSGQAYGLAHLANIEQQQQQQQEQANQPLHIYDDLEVVSERDCSQNSSSSSSSQQHQRRDSMQSNSTNVSLGQKRNGPAPHQQQQQLRGMTADARQAAMAIYSREIYDQASNAPSASAIMSNKLTQQAQLSNGTTSTIVQPLAASRTTTNAKRQQQFYSPREQVELNRAEEQFYED